MFDFLLSRLLTESCLRGPTLFPSFMFFWGTNFYSKGG